MKKIPHYQTISHLFIRRRLFQPYTDDEGEMIAISGLVAHNTVPVTL